MALWYFKWVSLEHAIIIFVDIININYKVE